MDLEGQGQECPNHVMLLYRVTMWRQNIVNSLQILHVWNDLLWVIQKFKIQGCGVLSVKYKTFQKPLLHAELI